MKNKMYYIVLLCILISSFFQIVLAEDKKTFVIGVQDFQEYLPESQYKNGEYTGFGRDLLDMFAKEYGYKFEYKALPIKRLYSDFVAENIDFKYPDSENWSADVKKGKKVKYSVSIVKYIDGVMVLPENKGKKIENLKSLGIPLGYTPFAYLELIKNGKIKISENPNYEGLLKQSIAGKIDGAYSNIAVANYYMTEIFKEKKLVFDDSLPNTKSTRHISTIKYPEIIDKFNKFMLDKKEDINLLKIKYEIETF